MKSTALQFHPLNSLKRSLSTPNLMLHPLLLPELLAFVATWVEPKDIPCCSLVCKTWYTLFEPMISWRICVVDNQDAPSPISLQSIRDNASHIHTLIFKGLIPPDYFSIHFPNLEILKIQGETLSFASFNTSRNGREALERMWSDVANFISNSSTLTTIQFSTNRSVLTNEIWYAIWGNPNARSLQLRNVKIDWRQAADFWKLCTVLEKLEMDTCLFDLPLEFSDSFSELSDNFPRIRELKFNDLRIPSRFQYELITQCPELESLYWRGKRTRPFPLQELHLSISSYNFFSKLDSLDVAGSTMNDADVYLAISYMKRPIKRLGLSQSKFGPLSFEALMSHFHTIQELDLTDCEHIHSKEIATMLRSCPLLISFKAGTLSSLDIEDYDPWACASRLQTLHVFIEVDANDIEKSSRRVFNCLSLLVSLQELNIAGKGRSSLLKAKPLQLRLECGLGYLSSLRNMKCFRFSERGQEMTMEEGNWIKENWKRSQLIEGRFSMNSKLNCQIQDLFREKNERYYKRINGV